jgi:membrane protease subunit HflC
VLRAEAQRQADTTRGEGDALRNKIFAEAFGKDPDFFAFWRSMQAYETGLKSMDTRLVLSPSSEFFRFFNRSGNAPVPALNRPTTGGPAIPGGAPAAAPASPQAAAPAPGPQTRVDN